MANRKPIVAGAFYKSSFDELDKQIADCFKNNKFGPGDLPVKKRAKKIFGVIAPHAGYEFSGAGAAWAYKEIAESEFPDLFVILGTNHTGLGAELSTYFFADWETPLGIVKVDKDFGKALVKNFPALKNEAMAHLQEHSIEVQLPFLQFVNKDKIKDVKILPIVLGFCDYEICKKLGEKIAETAKAENKKICIIASSDFTHYGASYGYLPFVHAQKENLYKLDGKAIDFIKRLDAKDFLDYKEKESATICGAFAIAAAIEACKNLGAKKAKLLQYYTSGDVIGDYSSAVGYAAIVFE